MELLAPFVEDCDGSFEVLADITSADCYADGFSGTDSSSVKRAELARSLGLPQDMTAKATLQAINLLGWQGKYLDFVNKSAK